MFKVTVSVLPVLSIATIIIIPPVVGLRVFSALIDTNSFSPLASEKIKALLISSIVIALKSVP